MTYTFGESSTGVASGLLEVAPVPAIDTPPPTVSGKMHIGQVVGFGFGVRFCLASCFFDQMIRNDDVRALGNRISIVHALIKKIDAEKSGCAERFNSRIDFFQITP